MNRKKKKTIAKASFEAQEIRGLLITEEARESFFNALENPAQPNAVLLSAFRRHGELMPNLTLPKPTDY